MTRSYELTVLALIIIACGIAMGMLGDVVLRAMGLAATACGGFLLAVSLRGAP